MKPALVIGGGIAGMQAALDIANAGFGVILVERTPSLGGHMLQFSKVFPTLDCPQCIGTPKMVEVATHPNIRLMTYSEIEAFSGYAGNFKARIRKKARSVIESKCTGCGVCQQKCPWKVDSEFNCSLAKRKAIYTPFPQAVPNIPVIDREHCVYFLKGTCRACEKFCEPRAIDFEQKDEIDEIEVGCAIVATGFEPFEPRLKPELGYGIYDNVLTALELERLDQAAGPTQGKILIHGKEPKNVAFLQCVGSRDETVGNKYCSRVCCMYTAKQAHYVKSKLPEAKVTVIYIDIRAYGKGYEQFYERVQQEGVIYRRGSVSEICRRGDKLTVRAEDTLLGEFFEEAADLVVLATGLIPPSGNQKMAETLGIPLDGFFRESHPKLSSMESGVEGIFLAGCCQGPKDIADSVIQASAAAAAACAMLAGERARV